LIHGSWFGVGKDEKSCCRTMWGMNLRGKG